MTLNKRFFTTRTETQPGYGLYDTYREVGWYELQPRLEGCDEAVLALGVGEYTNRVPMEYVIRLKDAE